VFQLTPHSFDVAVKEDWAPDGQHLVFTKDGDILIPGVSANIATIDPDGTHLRLVTLRANIPETGLVLLINEQ
jgi:hypothetical protein